MITIRTGQGGKVAIICADAPGSVPRERLVEAWGRDQLDLLPLARASLPFIDGDLVCIARLGSRNLDGLLASFGLTVPASLPGTPGSYAIQGHRREDRKLLLCLGNGLSGQLYAIEHLCQRGVLSPEGLTVENEPVLETPEFIYRILWTWDHSTNWNLGYEGQLDWGCFNAYLKTEEAYVDDFERLIDWGSRNRFNGLILWGFLRDSHGGVAASQQLCKRAAERGVRVLPGLGTSFYGGFYYAGEHTFSAEAWLARHPECAARDKQGRRTDRLCPSDPSNQDWLREGTHWLFETFDIGGVNLESGDFMVCYCERCQKLRQKMGGEDPEFFKEMVISIRPVIEEILSIREDAWITFGTYTGFNPGPLPQDLGDPDPSVVLNMANAGGTNPVVIQGLPPETITQWSLTAMLHQDRIPLMSFLDNGRPDILMSAPDWPVGLTPPGQHGLGLLHQGSQWYSRGRGHTRYNVEIASIKEACLRGSAAGLEGMAITGEMAPTYTPVELNYLAAAHFAYHPEDSLLAFAEATLAPLVGGKELAREFVQYMARRESGEMSVKDEEQLQDRLDHFASEVARGESWQAYRRWRWLSTFHNSEMCDGTASILYPETGA